MEDISNEMNSSSSRRNRGEAIIKLITKENLLGPKKGLNLQIKKAYFILDIDRCTTWYILEFYKKKKKIYKLAGRNNITYRGENSERHQTSHLEAIAMVLTDC